MRVYCPHFIVQKKLMTSPSSPYWPKPSACASCGRSPSGAAPGPAAIVRAECDGNFLTRGLMKRRLSTNIHKQAILIINKVRQTPERPHMKSRSVR